MTNEKLATRAVACKRWRWMPGMLAKTVWAETRILGGQADRPALATIDHYGNGFMMHHLNNLPCDSFPQADTAYPFFPDLTDPATLRCLLELVREAWGDAAAHAVPDGDWHIYGDMPETEYGTGDTEAAALVAALEAAP